MKKTLIVLFIVLALVLASVGTVMAITNGEPDDGRHPYVGLLVFDYAPGSPGWRCSGALIAPDVVLTAGHCTDGLGARCDDATIDDRRDVGQAILIAGAHSGRGRNQRAGQRYGGAHAAVERG